MVYILPTAPATGDFIDTGADRYIWNGSAWNLVGASPVVAVEYGEAVQPADIVIAAGTAGVHGTTLVTFTIPSAGIWRLTANVNGYGGGTSSAAAAFYDGSGTKVPNSEFGLLSTTVGIIGSGSSVTTYVATTGAATYTLRAGAWTASSNSHSNTINGRSRVTYEKISAKVASYYQAGAWINGGTLTVGATTTAPTKGTIVRDVVRYRELAPKTYSVEVNYAQAASTGAAGSGTYLFTLPAGLSFNTTQHTVSTTGVDNASMSSILASSRGSIIHTNTNNHTCAIIPYDATRYRVFGVSGTVSNQNFVGSTYYNIGLASGVAWNWAFEFVAA